MNERRENVLTDVTRFLNTSDTIISLPVRAYAKTITSRLFCGSASSSGVLVREKQLFSRFCRPNVLARVRFVMKTSGLLYGYSGRP